ncbi:hypothetical protein PMAYCL1PPCAC_00803, partial [Pristionchus mayeri]
FTAYWHSKQRFPIRPMLAERLEYYCAVLSRFSVLSQLDWKRRRQIRRKNSWRRHSFAGKLNVMIVLIISGVY